MGQPLNDDFFFEEDTQDAAEATHRALIDTQQQMGIMLEIMPMGLLIHTQQGVLFANQEACRMLGAKKEQLVGQHILDFIPSSEFEAVQDQINRTFNSGAEVISEESILCRPDGPPINIKLISAQLPWAGTPVIQILLQDVSDLKVKELALERLSTVDELTGAFNRRYVFSEATRLLRENRVPHQDLSVILLDVDHFKNINDTHGHGIGDQALISLASNGAEIVQSRAAQNGTFARVGGEEFLVLLSGYDEHAAVALAEELRHKISQIEVQTEAETFGFTISLGVASFGPQDASFERLVARADTALYEAKHLGRNRVILAR